MSKEILKINNIPIEVTKKKNIKSIYIRVIPPLGNVKVSAPLRLNDQYIISFIIENISKINEAREKIFSQKIDQKKNYTTGEIHYLWGKPYNLQVTYYEKLLRVNKVDKNILMSVPKLSTVEDREKLLNNWYREELKKVLCKLTEKCENIMKVHAEEYRIKNMKTRWGTCNITKKRIWINLQLVKKPIECLEYVIIHELAHLLEKNHNSRFHSIVSKYCPSWKDIQRLLSMEN